MSCSAKAESLSAAYGYRIVVRGVSFEAGPGSVLALIGPNGAGKTTILKVLAGIVPVAGGRVEACGFRAGRGERLQAYRLVGYSPAVPDADYWMGVGDLIMSSRVDLGGSREEPARRAAKRLGLEELWGRRFGELSTGEKKLVMLAAALAREPRLLLLDEPTFALDLRNQALVASLIREEAESGTTVVVASHELHLLESYADEALLVSGGRQVAYGSLEEVLDKKLLEKVYGVELEERRAFLPATRSPRRRL